MKNRKEKQNEYKHKYADIPINYNERLLYMCNLYNISEKRMEEILIKKSNMIYNMEYYEFLIVLYEIPEGLPRPRFRIVNKRNFMDAAIIDSQYVHVYQPSAFEDHTNFIRLLDTNQLGELHTFIQTPCKIEYNAYFETPSSFSITDKFLAELGLHEYAYTPDWDNIGKKYSDYYNNKIWLDDALVTSGTVNKLYSILPRVEIKLRYLNYATNKYQFNKIVNRKLYNENYPINYLDNTGKAVHHNEN